MFKFIGGCINDLIESAFKATFMTWLGFDLLRLHSFTSLIVHGCVISLHARELQPHRWVSVVGVKYGDRERWGQDGRQHVDMHRSLAWTSTFPSCLWLLQNYFYPPKIENQSQTSTRKSFTDIEEISFLIKTTSSLIYWSNCCPKNKDQVFKQR